jgi:hypothetical protein
VIIGHNAFQITVSANDSASENSRNQQFVKFDLSSPLQPGMNLNCNELIQNKVCFADVNGSINIHEVNTTLRPLINWSKEESVIDPSQFSFTVFDVNCKKTGAKIPLTLLSSKNSHGIY